MGWWWKRRLLLVEGLANASSKNERMASSTRCCHSAGRCWKRISFLLSFVGTVFFSLPMRCLYSCQRPLGVSAYFNNYFNLIWFFFNLFISYGGHGIIPKNLKKDWVNWKSEEESRSSRQNWLDYLAKCKRAEEIYCHLNSSENLPLLPVRKTHKE